MKIACCQLDPIWGDRDANMERVNEWLSGYGPGDMDLLVLPEMAFSGYVYNSVEEIKPMAEDAETGPTVEWTKKQAVRLRCHVVVGYPETQNETYYNSLCCVDPEGRLVTTYRKTFLYTTDENWATEGPGFLSMVIDGLGKVGFGICMDINPYRFEASFHDFEFANFHLEHSSELIICIMAWLKSPGPGSDTVRYWATRMTPLITRSSNKPVCFVACNRTGTERGVTFAGRSCVLEFSDDRIRLVDGVSEDFQGIKIIEV